MRRTWAWIAAAFGALAAVVAWRRRRSRQPEPSVEAAPADSDPRAAELRAKLDEARAAAPGRAEDEAGEIPVDEAEAGLDPDERRREVHAEGRAAIDEMQGTAPAPPGDQGAA